MVTRRLGWLTSCQAIGIIGAPYRNRTGVFAVRGRRPGPLDEGSLAWASEITPIRRRRQRGRPGILQLGRPNAWRAPWVRVRLARKAPLGPGGHMRRRLFNWQAQRFLYLGLEGEPGVALPQQSSGLFARADAELAAFGFSLERNTVRTRV